MPTKVAGTMSNDLLRTDISTQSISLGTVLTNLGFAKVFPIGVIMLWPTSSPTGGWLVCDGTVYNIVDYPELEQLIGNAYGGNGTTTFAVPNMTASVPSTLSAGSGCYMIRAFYPTK